MSDGEPIIPFPQPAPQTGQDGAARGPSLVRFNRDELSAILNLYGRYVASGEWRDYAMDFGKDTATFSVFRRAAEQPLYRIIKNPELARKQGAYAVTAQGGLILKRGHDLGQVRRVLINKPKLA